MFSITPSTARKGVAWSVGFLIVVALLSLVGPIYRSFLGIIINSNEGWNAFYADAAMGKMNLYPSLNQLITNNYPPLSFYCVGIVGKLLGDNILAGRLLSLMALGVITFFIVQIIKILGGTWKGGLIGGAYFVATLSLFFRWYIGANDPQLLAQAVMVCGFFLFLKAAKSGRGYWIAMLVMVVAGFFKHNIVTLPLSSMLWLGVQQRWRTFFFCNGFSLLLIIIGFTCCYAAYGVDFFYNLLTPRQLLLEKISQEFMDLSMVVIGLGFWFFASWKFHREASVQLITIMMFVGLVVGCIQRLGSGVFVNAQFDLVFAVAIGVGVVFQLFLQRHYYAEPLQMALIVALTLPFFMAPTFFVFLNIFSPAYQTTMACMQQQIAERIALVRAIPGDVFCESYIAYKAGKPFAVDIFNVQERIKAGTLPADAITRRVHQQTLTEVNYIWDVGIE